MKLNFFRFLVLAAAALILGSTAYAQTIHVRAQVPFDFTLGDKVYPAGEYTIQSPEYYSHSLFIRSGKVDASAVTLSYPTTSLKPAKQTVLVFHGMGNTYFLSELWCADSKVGREFPRSHTESKMAMKQTKPEMVTVTANIIP